MRHGLSTKNKRIENGQTKLKKLHKNYKFKYVTLKQILGLTNILIFFKMV